MGTQELIIALREGEAFHAGIFRKTLKDVDYTIRDIRIKMSGKVVMISEKKSDKFSDLVFKAGDQVFHILSDFDEEEPRVKHKKLVVELKTTINAEKSKWTVVGQVLEVEGTVGVLLEKVYNSVMD